MAISQPTYPVTTADLVTHVGAYTDASAAPSIIERQRALWKPSTALYETHVGGRFQTMTANALLTSGRLFLQGGVVLAAGVPVNTITLFSGNVAAVTPANQWFCLVRQSDLAPVAKTVDDTTTAWAAQSPKPLALSATYTPSVEEAVYVGCVVAAATPPNLLGMLTANSSNVGAHSLAPIVSGQSTTALTNPASLGANAGAITAQAWGFYALVG